MKHKVEAVEIFTDGACRGNPGRGGWGVFMRYGEHTKKMCGFEAETTNNRMELTAVIKALSLLKKNCSVKIHTDSKYVFLGVTEYLRNWQRNGWKTADKKPVKNLDLWQDLLVAMRPHEIKWYWVKGHSGHHENETADLLANQAIDENGG